MSKNAQENRNDNLQLKEVMIRFVYQDEVKGEWINGLDAFRNTFMAASSVRRVIRIEMEMAEQPPRKAHNE